MKGTYTDGPARAQGYFTRNNRWYLADLWVPPLYRRQGRASDIMRWICADADAAHVIITLEVVPEPSGIAYYELEEFYASFGFIADHSGLMSRLPLTPKA